MRGNDLLEVPDAVIRAATPFGAGFGFSQCTCAALLAGGLALGLKFGRTDRGTSRKDSWSRASRLMECFVERWHTSSCAEITREFDISAFASVNRVENCMEVIAFATRHTALLLFDRDDTFSDPRKEEYFSLREGSRE